MQRQVCRRSLWRNGMVSFDRLEGLEISILYETSRPFVRTIMCGKKFDYSYFFFYCFTFFISLTAEFHIFSALSEVNIGIFREVHQRTPTESSEPIRRRLLADFPSSRPIYQVFLRQFPSCSLLPAYATHAPAPGAHLLEKCDSYTLHARMHRSFPPRYS